MSSVGPCYQGQAKRGQQKESCAFGHERKRYRTMQSFLGFDSTVEVTSYQHNYCVPDSGLVKSENVLEKLNKLTCVASNWLSNMCPKQTSQHLAKDSAATIPIFFRDLFSSNYGITADKRKMDYSSGCGNIGSDSLTTVRGWGSPYHTNNITRHYCSKRGHMGQKQIPLYPSNMFTDGFLSSFVRSHFPPTNVHDRMEKSKGSQNHTTHFCKHQCVMQDTQLEKLAEEAKLKPYNTKLRLKALMGQKCSLCQKNMEGQIDDHAVTKKEELDVSSEKRVDRSTGNHKASSQWTSDAQIHINLKTCDNTVTRKDVHDDVFWKYIGADKQIGGHGVNFQQTCSSPVNKSLETCDIMSEAKEDDIINKIEKNSQIDWFEYSCAQGGIMPISDNVIRPSLPVKISKPVDTHVVTCDSDSQTIKSCEKRNEKGENKLAIPRSWSCVEELPDFAKTPEVAFENSSLNTSKSDCKVQNSISGDSSSNEREDNEGVSAENSKKKTSDSDTSCVLYIRKCSAGKKTRPSSKKRRRQKAKLQQVPQHCRDNPDKDENLSGSKTLAFMLGMDSSPINSHFTHSFIVSFDDGNSDWSDSDDFDCSPEETGKDELCELQNSFGLMNLRVSCMNGTVKESKPHIESRKEECSKHDLDAINMSWKINIPLNDRPTKQKLDRRKVHFPNDKNLVTLHPMIAWSYAYATARKGPWEEYARDRDRFQRRIQETECILAPILKHDHRSTIYKNYFEAE